MNYVHTYMGRVFNTDGEWCDTCVEHYPFQGTVQDGVDWGWICSNQCSLYLGKRGYMYGTLKVHL